MKSLQNSGVASRQVVIAVSEDLIPTLQIWFRRSQEVSKFLEKKEVDVVWVPIHEAHNQLSKEGSPIVVIGINEFRHVPRLRAINPNLVAVMFSTAPEESDFIDYYLWKDVQNGVKTLSMFLMEMSIRLPKSADGLILPRWLSTSCAAIKKYDRERNPPRVLPMSQAEIDIYAASITQ